MSSRKLPLAERPWATRADGASVRRLPVLEEVRPLDREDRAKYAVWEITLRCDLSCRHCGSRAGKARPDELTTEEALNLVDQMADLGVREISMIGGEAYLRADWATIAMHIRARGIDCGMVTGGRNFTRELAQQAKDAGVQAVSVSVDGLEATHDRLRGVRGSFRAAMDTLEHLAAVGLTRSVNTQINRWNLREIEPLFEQIAPTGIHAWQVQFTVAMARAADEPDMLLEPYQLIEAMPLVARIDRLARERGVRVWSGNNVGYFGPYERQLFRSSKGQHHEPCSAGRVTLGVEANGDIKGCPSLPTADYVGGNIRDLPLRTIWEATAPLRFTRESRVDELWGFCRGCYYAEDCLAGCTWTGHVLFGKRGNNPLCHHRALELLREGRRERLVRVAAPEGHPFDYGLFEIVVEDWPTDERARAERIAESGEGWLKD